MHFLLKSLIWIVFELSFNDLFSAKSFKMNSIICRYSCAVLLSEYPMCVTRNQVPHVITQPRFCLSDKSFKTFSWDDSTRHRFSPVVTFPSEKFSSRFPKLFQVYPNNDNRPRMAKSCLPKYFTAVVIPQKASFSKVEYPFMRFIQTCFISCVSQKAVKYL